MNDFDKLAVKFQYTMAATYADMWELLQAADTSPEDVVKAITGFNQFLESVNAALYNHAQDSTMAKTRAALAFEDDWEETE